MHFEKKATIYTVNICTIVWNVFLKRLNKELGQKQKNRLQQKATITRLLIYGYCYNTLVLT